jgi:hypothetical protein
MVEPRNSSFPIPAVHIYDYYFCPEDLTLYEEEGVVDVHIQGKPVKFDPSTL